MEINQFRPISRLNVEGKVFSVVARRLTSYLEKNRLIDTMVESWNTWFIRVLRANQHDLAINSVSEAREERPACCILGSG